MSFSLEIMLKYALLGFLHDNAMTGYELEQIMSRSTSNFWYAKLSQIYMTLKKLEEEALVESHVEPQEDRPDRRVYTITDAGRADLRAWLADPVIEIDTHKHTLLLKLFFSAQLDKEAILTQLRIQRNLHHKQMVVYRDETKAHIEHMVEIHPQVADDALFWEATRRFGELYEEMYTRWLDETISNIEKHFSQK
jgi:PadR family transcriptional regulator, regulatory protein AphA